ncbi:MAG: hypothetical protein FJ031_09500 [Chloroflexi bacterium]|nr:hypothetical protein [Chloroflexota bacterium]
MTSKIPSLTHAEIQNWVGLSSFQKGMPYFSSGAIYDARRLGQSLKARCCGSQAAYYLLQVTFGLAGIVSAGCSCPVGDGGRCKHVAALLLTWFDSPDSFEEIEDPTTTLEKHSKEELIAIIRQMIQREPDLAVLLEMPLPGRKTDEKPLDAQVIRRQARHAMRRVDLEEDWEGAGGVYEAVADLQPLLDLAGQYLGQASPGNAAIIFREVAETLLGYEDAIMTEESSRLGSVIDDCAEGLGECLKSMMDAAQREKIQKGLFDIYAWDVEAGGIGIGDGVMDILLEQATPQERQMIAGWAKATLHGKGDWSRRAMGGLILELQADSMDDESFLEVCRQTGRLKDLVERLLTLKRINEAVSESQRASDYDLLSLADLFVQHGHGSLAETFIKERTKTSQDTRLIEWLKEYAKKQGDLAQALGFAEKLFWLRPTVEAYVEVRQLAQTQQQWAELRNKTLESLAQKGKHDILTEIFLEEGQIDQALSSLDIAKKSNRYWGGSALQLRVAQAAGEQRPKESIRLYMQLIEPLIAQRGRENYAQAARHLRSVRDTYLRLGEPHTWQALIAHLREQHRNLPALKDELNRAKL